MGCGGDNYFNDDAPEYESWVRNYSVGDVFEGPIIQTLPGPPYPLTFVGVPQGYWMITKVIPETNQQTIDEGYGFNHYEMVQVNKLGQKLGKKTHVGSAEVLSHMKAKPIARIK